MTRRLVVYLWLVQSGAAAWGSPPMPRFGDTLSRDERALAKLAFEGLWDGREQLVSGVVKVTCEPRGDGPDRPDPLFLAFDRASSRLRFDQTMRGITTQVARTPRETLLHVSGGYVLTRHPPNYDTTLEATRPIDVRLAGLVTLGEFFNRFDYEAFADFLAQTVCTKCGRASEGLIRVELEYVMLNTTERFRRTIVLDPRLDYSPGRLRHTG